ncbi:MAG: lipase [Rhizobiaceae bacterium]
MAGQLRTVILRMLTVGLISILGWTASPGLVSAEETAKRSRFKGDVVLVRGGFNVFSEGLDTIAGKLAKKGIEARVYRHREVETIFKSILTNQKKFGRRPIILVGHSWGANAILRVAEKLKKRRMKVRYMVTIAATNPDPAPRNIQKLTNYYFKKNGWGEPVRAGAGFRGNLKNIDMSSKSEVHHFNVDEHPKLQSQIINNVVRFLRVKKYAQQKSNSLITYSAAVGTRPAG